MAIVVPAGGQLKATAQQLLDLADSPRDVRTTGNGLEFEVPDELADRYHGVMFQARDQGSHSADTRKVITDEPDAASARPVKRRGRTPRVDLEG